MSTYKGAICARIVSARFAIAGKVSAVNKHTGDTVSKGNLIASLDKKILQADLDKELADFEKVRADFEIFAQKYPDPQDATDKYLKTEKQAMLNASVKQVELAKAVLDQCDLFSPVDGVIIDDSSIVPGVYVTPAGSEFKIVDNSSYYFEFGIEQKDIKYFSEQREGKIKIEGMEKEIAGKTSAVLSDGKKFCVRILINDPQGLLPGLSAEVKL